MASFGNDETHYLKKWQDKDVEEMTHKPFAEIVHELADSEVKTLIQFTDVMVILNPEKIDDQMFVNE